MIQTPTLRDQLADGPPLLGTFLIVPRIEIIELLALAGFDVVVLDCEHGPFGIEALPSLLAAAKAAGMWSIVRVPELRQQAIGAALDAGADGVLVPHVRSGQAAADVVAAARFAPEGSRGANPYVRAAGYSGAGDFFASANARAACLAMVEGHEGVAAIDSILDVSGLDAVFVGPIDLSAALSVPGESEHPSVVETVSRIVGRGRERGIATAVFAPTPAAAARWLALGARFVALGVDTGLMLSGFENALVDVRAHAASLSPQAASTS